MAKVTYHGTAEPNDPIYTSTFGAVRPIADASTPAPGVAVQPAQRTAIADLHMGLQDRAPCMSGKVMIQAATPKPAADAPTPTSLRCTGHKNARASDTGAPATVMLLCGHELNIAGFEWDWEIRLERRPEGLSLVFVQTGDDLPESPSVSIAPIHCAEELLSCLSGQLSELTDDDVSETDWHDLVNVVVDLDPHLGKNLRRLVFEQPRGPRV